MGENEYTILQMAIDNLKQIAESRSLRRIEMELNNEIEEVGSHITEPRYLGSTLSIKIEYVKKA